MIPIEFGSITELPSALRLANGTTIDVAIKANAVIPTMALRRR
jgi:hypothetical protein